MAELGTLDLQNLQNAVLVDAAAVSDAFATYGESLGHHQLLDIFNFIEQLILRDKIIAVGGKRLVASRAWEFLELWTREGALWMPKTRVPVGSLPTPSRSNDGRWHATAREQSRSQRGVRRLAAAEQMWQQPAMPLNAHRHYFDSLVHTDIQNGVFDLVAQLGRVTGKTLSEYQLGPRAQRAFLDLELPPLAFAVFRRIDRIEQLPEETLRQRERYFDLRMQLRALIELLLDPSKTDEAKILEVKKWKRSWKKLEDDPLGGKSYRFQLGSSEVLKAIWACGQLAVAPDPVQASQLLGTAPTVLDGVATAYRRMGPKKLVLRPVYDTFAEFLAVSARDRARVVRRVVGRQLDNARQQGHRTRYGSRFIT